MVAPAAALDGPAPARHARSDDAVPSAAPGASGGGPRSSARITWKTTHVDGYPVRYGEVGSGPTALFLHGWGLRPNAYARPIEAMAASVEASLKNPRAVAAWGLTVAVLLVLGSIPLFVGLAVALPVLGYATWRLYTRTIVR